MNSRTIYIECDIPPGMTCAEYRRLRRAPRRPRRPFRINRPLFARRSS